MMRSRAHWIRGVFLLLAAWGAWRLGGQSEASLSVEIRDGGTGGIVPAMVCITSLADGKWRTPPDGGVVPPYSTLRDFYEPKPWKPGEIGPVRLTTADPPDNRARVKMYQGQISYPYWHEPAAYFVSEPFSIRLPPGKWRLAVAHGLEFVPFAEEFEVSAGQRVERKLRLRRWVDMPRLGWYSGDEHVHYPRTTEAQSEFLLTWARAEDVHVASILSFGDIKGTYFEQAGYGKPFHYQRGDYVLASGQEDPRTDIAEQGHTISLNITAPVRDVSRYHLYDYVFDQVHKQGGLTGYAHLAWAPEYYRRLDAARHPTWDPNINVVRGKIDFFEILQFRHLGLEDFYDFLNLGFKLTAVAGSDMPWASSIGEVRTYAYSGGHFSANAWYGAVKAGHTFVTNGPMLTLTAEKALPGDEVKIAGSRRIRVRARAWAPKEIGEPKLLEIVSDGQVIKTAASDVDFTMNVNASQWIAARVTCENGATAHTSPIYFVVDNASFRDESRLPSLIEKRLSFLDFIEGRLRNSKFTREYAAGEAPALLERIAQARLEYQKLKKAP